MTCNEDGETTEPTGRRVPVLLFPVIAGSGARLYDGIDSTDFDVVDVKRLENGVLGLTYVPAFR